MREPNETAEDLWTRILRQKECEFDNVTPAELIASKFLALIGRSTGDYEVKKNILKCSMTIGTITDLIHEYMHDRLNDSDNSNDGRNVKHVQKRPQKRKWSEKSGYERNIRDRSTKTTVVDKMEHQTGQDNTCAQLERQSAIIAERKGTMKNCADFRRRFNTSTKHHHQSMKITGITTKYRV